MPAAADGARRPGAGIHSIASIAINSVLVPDRTPVPSRYKTWHGAFAGNRLLSEGALTQISLSLNGTATDTGNSSSSPYTGLVTFASGFTTAGIASAIDTGGSISGTYSGELMFGTPVSSVPEPSTLAFLSVGLVLISIPRKRFGKR